MIDEGLLAARLLLAVVFAVAGIGKLVEFDGAREAVRDFGGPADAKVTALTLIAAELAVAIGLVVTAAAWWAALGALALLALLSAVVARSLRRGEAPICHCFGHLYAARAGRGTLARNAALAAVAAAVVVVGGPSDAGASATRWVGRLDEAGAFALAAALVCAALLFAGGWLATELLRRNGRLILRVDQLEEALVSAGIDVPAPIDPGERPVAGAGHPAPSFWLPDLDGRRVTLADLLTPRRELALVFASTSCHPCRMLLRWLADSDARLGGRRVVVIGDGDVAQWQALPPELAPETVLLQRAAEVADRYGAEVTPTAVLISAEGVLAAAPALGASAARELLLERPPGDGHAPAATSPAAIQAVQGVMS